MMKANKKMVMALCFCLGLILTVTTAFADIASQTGYDRFKDAIKYTAENMSEKLGSFTMQSTVTLKDNDKVLVSSSSTNKYDNKAGATENSSSEEFANGEKNNSYSYRDTKSSIWYNPQIDTYYESTYPEKIKFELFSNPFKEDRAKDVERLFDAVVGNLKDYVIVEDKSDGSKEISGSLSEGQIPALVNAATAFLFKQAYPDMGYGSKQVPIPVITDDIFIKNIKGKAEVNKDGIIESIFATGVLTGKDKDGKAHELTLEMLGKTVDINSTTVKKPDLTGKNVEKQIEKTPDQNMITAKYIGKYKNDIIIEKNNQFVKIGERIVEITNINDKTVSGHYYEQYKEGYSEYASNKLDITINTENSNYNNAEFKFTDSSGRELTGSISFDISTGKLYLGIPFERHMGGIMFDSSFSRVFDE